MIQQNNEADASPSPNSRWRHVKSGTLYDVVAVGYLERDVSPVVVYRGVVSETVWVRPLSEFLDGRFVPSADEVGKPVGANCLHYVPKE